MPVEFIIGCLSRSLRAGPTCEVHMSGHSKWATIKHKKAALDAKRGKSFTRIIKEIMIAARTGGDPDMNPRLRTAIAAATDNRNRTVSEIRHMFAKNGGNLGEQGSVAWMFERKSQILIPQEKATEDQLMNIVLDAGADDLRNDGTHWEVISPPEAHDNVLQALQKAGIPTESAEISMVPKNSIKLEGKNAGAMLRLSEALEEHDDVQNVYSNFDVDEKEMEAL